MNTTICNDHHALRTAKAGVPQLAAHLVHNVIGRIGSAVTKVLDLHAKRRSVASLRRLDAHQLRDIGLMESDLDFVLSRPLSEDPSHALRQLTQQRRQAERAMRRANRTGLSAERLGRSGRPEGARQDGSQGNV